MDFAVTSVMSLISHVHSLSQDFLQKKMGAAGLPELASSHGFILFCLSQTERMTLGDLAQKINRDKSTTTVLVRKLEQADLVTLQKDGRDTRKKFISLTEKGRDYNAVTARLSEDLLATSYRGFSDAEKTELLRLLLKLYGNLGIPHGGTEDPEEKRPAVL